MKKGDLVKFDATFSSQQPQLELFWPLHPELLNEAAIVVSDVYEGQVRKIDAVSGKAYSTQLASVVDIMISGKIITEMPIHYLRRIT